MSRQRRKQPRRRNNRHASSHLKRKNLKRALQAKSCSNSRWNGSLLRKDNRTITCVTTRGPSSMRRIFTIRLALNVALPSKWLPEFNFFNETPHYSDKSCYFGPRFPIGLRALCIQGKCHVSPTAPRPVSPRSFRTGKSRAGVRCLWFDARNGPRRRIRACQRVRR